VADRNQRNPERIAQAIKLIFSFYIQGTAGFIENYNSKNSIIPTLLRSYLGPDVLQRTRVISGCAYLRNQVYDRTA
jgi:hypothetical protein